MDVISPLACLCLNSSTFVGRSKAHQKLIHIFGYKHGNTLFGHLPNRQCMTKEQIILQGANDHTVRIYEKQITDAGISLALTQSRSHNSMTFCK